MIQPPAEQICGSRASTPGKSMAAAVAEPPSEGVPTVGMPAAGTLSSPLFSPQRRPQPSLKGSDLPQESLLRWIRTAGSCVFVIRWKFLQ